MAIGNRTRLRSKRLRSRFIASALATQPRAAIVFSLTVDGRTARLPDDLRQVASGQDCEEARRHGLTAAHGLGEAARNAANQISDAAPRSVARIRLNGLLDR